MKRIWRSVLLITVLACILCPLSACGKDDKTPPAGDPSGILVAYFSATGNTEKVAEKIADITGGTLYEIEPQIPYVAEDLTYSTDCRANREQNDPASRPAIEGSVSDMDAFDVVYLGYPIWWSEAPKIVYTFLESYDFSGKTIIPFCTSDASGIGNSANHLHGSASGATWLSGNRFPESPSKNDVKDWLDGLTY